MGLVNYFCYVYNVVAYLLFKQSTDFVIMVLSHLQGRSYFVHNQISFSLQALPFGAVLDAGHVPPTEVVAVVRPTAFDSVGASKNLDQKYIARVDSDMALEIKFRAEDGNLQEYVHIYSGRVSPSSREGIQGLYIFSMEWKCSKLFEKAGEYKFSLNLVSSRDTRKCSLSHLLRP